MRRAPILIVGIAFAALVSAGAVLASHANDRGSAGKVSTGASVAGFSVLRNTATAVEPDARVKTIADDMGATAVDLHSFHVLADGLGKFDSRLIAYPAMSGRNVCYALLATAQTDPGMSYCYRPGATNAPPELADERFSVVAPESRTGEKLEVATQVFGVADDSVVSLRVLVSGVWRDLPIRNNGFVLELPGVARSEVGMVEATLDDGSMQVHDLQTGE